MATDPPPACGLTDAGGAAGREADDRGKPPPVGANPEQAVLETAVFREFFSTPAGSAAGPALGSTPAKPGDVLGDYQLLDVVGEGGMGVVFRARQCTADRIVALKVIRAERLAALGPDKAAELIGRFRHEAQAAAHLEHDHLVTVYDVGEAAGRQYYSMRYVDGPSLAHLLRDGPLRCRRAAGYLEPVARAVEEAHRQGILHRDLKPQNILVDGRTDRALVADFGLAKLIHGEEGLTRAGEVMGTPAYMSPEQAQDAGRASALSDVYALGATLYHLITGRPVFQAATAVETLRQVADATPVPPRRLNPAVDRDLDTICLKCLEKEPARRYASAGRLADDLHRYLQGQPILARPIGPLGRTARWGRRNPVSAALVAIAAACLLMTLAAVSVAYLQTAAAYRRSDKSFRQALEMVNVFFTRVSEETLLDQPGLQPLRRDLLRQARDYYHGFLAQRDGDATIEQELAETQYRVGVITSEIESAEQSLPHFELALAALRRLTERDPDAATAVVALGDALNEKAKALYALGRLDEAVRTFREARQRREQVVGPGAAGPEAERKLANTVMNIGVVLHALKEDAEARRHFEEAQSLRRTLLDRVPREAKLLRDMAKAEYNLGNLWHDAGETADCRRHFQAAVERFEKLREIENVIDDRYHLNLCYERLADLEAAPDRRLGLYQLALDGLEQLAMQNPQVDRFRAASAGILIEMGRIELGREKLPAARAAFDRASGLLSQLVSSNAVPSHRRDLAIAWQGLAATLLATAPQQARDHLARSGRCLAELVREFPDQKEYRELKQRNEAMLAALAEEPKG